MSLTAAGLWALSLWLAIHAVKHTLRRPRFLLPLSHGRGPTTELTVKHFNIRLTTETFNFYHDKLSIQLSPNNSRISRQVLLKLYDFGSLVGIIGMLLGFCLLFLTAASLSSEILRAGRDTANTVTKRGLVTTLPASDFLRITPIIPGLTVPFSHIPLILVALSLSQIAHEFGHAITAALHRIPMSSCGIAVTFLLPSAFVTLPIARLEKLPPRDRLQIVSGGCFHNVVLLCFSFFVAWSRAGSLLTWILFQDISAHGKLVIGVDYDSPLATYLPVGTLVTKIDDSPMGSVLSDDPWHHYLLSPSLGSMKGWCASNVILTTALAPVCTRVNGAHSCFVSMADETIQYELDAVDTFTDNLPRCNSSADCPSVSSCVVPRSDQQLVRVSILNNRAGRTVEDIIVWKGPKDEIWEQVQVGNLRSRLPLVPLRLPEYASTFLEYTKLANLSLYLINMLPIKTLDGYQLLVTFLQFLYSRVSNDLETIDLEALNHTRSGREGRVQRACRTFLSFLALLLVVFCGLLGAISWAWK